MLSLLQNTFTWLEHSASHGCRHGLLTVATCSGGFPVSHSSYPGGYIPLEGQAGPTTQWYRVEHSLCCYPHPRALCGIRLRLPCPESTSLLSSFPCQPCFPHPLIPESSLSWHHLHQTFPSSGSAAENTTYDRICFHFSFIDKEYNFFISPAWTNHLTTFSF